MSGLPGLSASGSPYRTAGTHTETEPPPTAEVGASALIQHDGLLLVSQRVPEGASGEAGAHAHVFAAAGAVRQDDGAAGAGAVLLPQARPADDVVIVEIVDLLPVRRIPAKAEERVQLRAHRADLVMGNAVIIPVEDAGKAFPAQEDHARRRAA